MPNPLRLFPLNTVLFPGAVLNLHVFEPRYKQLIKECVENGEAFGVVLIREGAEAGDPSVEPHEVGSLAEITEVTALPFDRYYVSTIGRRRFRIDRILNREPYLTVDAELLPEPRDDEADLYELSTSVRVAFVEYVDLAIQAGARQGGADLPPDTRAASFVIADALEIADDVKQGLLELSTTKQRLIAELEFLRSLLPQLRTLVQRREEKIRETGSDAADPHRGEQERYFGRYFSPN